MIQTNLKPGPAMLRELSPLECAVTKNAPVSPLESTPTNSFDLKPFRMNTYEKRWVGGWRPADGAAPLAGTGTNYHAGVKIVEGNHLPSRRRLLSHGNR